MQTPAGYPAHLEEHISLADGRKVFLRPILPADSDEIARALEQADAKTLLHRFFTAAPHLGPKQIHYLAEVDYVRRLALVAIDDEGHGVGVARYEGLTDPGTAEVAVVVHPDWRRQGLGRALVERLEAPAAAHGMDRLTAVYLRENDAVAGLFAGLGYSPPRFHDGMVSVDKRIG